MQVRANAKIILAGEHAVLRGKSAILIPISNKQLKLNFDCKDIFSHNCFGEYVFDECNKLWGKFIEQAFIECTDKKPHGSWDLEINIPVGVGLGFSSALCVVVAKAMAKKNYIKDSEIFTFAHKLEQPIHGKSSGCDIAGSLSSVPIIYNIEKTRKMIAWSPALAWSTPCDISRTQGAIEKVEKKNKPEVDEFMHKATKLAYKSWKQKNVSMLADSINMANDCFVEWGLVTSNLEKHMIDLIRQGAIAVKPTGAGGGGSVISLWHEKTENGELNWIA